MVLIFSNKDWDTRPLFAVVTSHRVLVLSICLIIGQVPIHLATFPRGEEAGFEPACFCLLGQGGWCLVKETLSDTLAVVKSKDEHSAEALIN